MLQTTPMLLQTTHLLQSIGNVAIYTVIGLALFGLSFFIMGKATPFSLRKEIEDESLYWQTSTVGKLVRGLLLVNPETILADGVFVIPGSSEDGLSEEDLLLGGWSYLRVLT